VDLFGTVLYEADGNVVGIETIEDKSIIGIYFGAGWCPACAEFTPLLVSFYTELELADKSFEVVLVSFDNSMDDMFAHMTDRAMPWLAVPFGGEKAAALTRQYEVGGIPTLIVIDGEGNTITVNGRGDVVTKGALAYDDWLAISGG
jgi:thiol-disulfide isomerase/thioredoxin